MAHHPCQLNKPPRKIFGEAMHNIGPYVWLDFICALVCLAVCLRKSDVGCDSLGENCDEFVK